LAATSWAYHEFGHARLGDARRTKRLVALAMQRVSQPQGSIAQSCGGRAASKAAYRFYGNEAIAPQEIQASHQQRLRERLRAEQWVLAVQDTTQLDYSRHPATRGLGYLQDLQHQGLLVHTTLAVTARRVPLGVIAQQVWARAEGEYGKRHRRRQRPTGDKESQKWVHSLQATHDLEVTLPGTHLVSVGDSEADVYDLLREALRLEQALLVRACRDRRVEHEEQYLWAHLESQAPAGTLQVSIPAHPGRAARTARVTVRYAEVVLRPPRWRRQEKLPLLPVWAVLVREETPPAEAEAVEWLLLTIVAVTTFAQACERILWYTCRWVVEMYHRVLKSGCRLEERQFDHAATIQRYLALDAIVAWRVLYLTMIGRAQSQLPCEALLEAREWQALYCFIHHTSVPPAEPPTLGQVTRWIAQLGGFLGRRSDGEPGSQVIWQGLQRLHDIALAWQIFHPDLPAAGCG